MFAYRSQVGRVDVVFTDRCGGVSRGPFSSLNLGYGGGDEPAAVASNFELTAAALGSSADTVVPMRQVHGRDVVVVDSLPGTPPRADALVTTTAELLLCVRAADCAPVLLVDESAGVIGCAHAGRTGLAAGVVPNTVAAMRGLGAKQILAFVGPHVCGGCYEVPSPLRAKVARSVPAAYATTRWGTPALDIGAGVRAQLEESGCRVVGVGGCTFESANLFSYRRNGGGSGRQAGLVRIRR